MIYLSNIQIVVCVEAKPEVLVCTQRVTLYGQAWKVGDVLVYFALSQQKGGVWK
jgi:hypothetical protein